MPALDCEDVRIACVERLDDVAVRTRADRAFVMVLVAIAATVAVVVGLVGVYAVVSYTVKQRVTEIGVRIAVGVMRLLRLRVGGLRDAA